MRLGMDRQVAFIMKKFARYTRIGTFVSSVANTDWLILRSSSLLSIDTTTSTGGKVWSQAEATACCKSFHRSMV